MNKRLLPVIEKITELLEKKEHIIIGIDGNCASGKTTMAAELSDIFPSTIIHMDDFFLPSNLRSKERYDEIGGNIHYERFLEEVVENQDKDSFFYRIFSCKEMDYIENVHVKRQPLTIIEGAYSHHPKFSDIYDIKIFSYADIETQKIRIRERNGEEGLENFVSKWIPLEERYFNHCHTKEESQFVI